MKTQEEPESPPSRHSRSSSQSSKRHETPLPKGQLAILAVIALAEQTALKQHITISTGDGVNVSRRRRSTSWDVRRTHCISICALAQFATNFIWGWLSDKIGRKPIILLGTFLTACCFVAFGFCRTLWQAIIVQAAMGLVNGNSGVVSTCLGEITDRSNQSRAFKYLPVIYGLGGITGPIVGGTMVKKKNPLDPEQPNPYPYLLPNLFSAAVLIVDLVLSMIFLQESLECAQELPPLGKRMVSMFTWIWQFSSSHRPTYLKRGKRRPKSNGYQPVANPGNAEETDHSGDEEDDNDENMASFPSLVPNNQQEQLTKGEVFNRDTILLLITFLIFQLANISYNSLYPIFAQASPPTGRNLDPEEIGISLAFAGIVTILFQVGVFGRIREKIGNKVTYRAGLALFVISFVLMPWIGYKDGSSGEHKPTTRGQAWLWIELAVVLIIKTVAAVGGLTSALLLITNSAPSHAVLGTLNGLAQTLSAAGRAVGPFISGSLFTAAIKVRPKGEALAFGVFGGISFLGFLLSFGIRGVGLEAEGFDEHEHDEEEGSEEESDESPERRR